VKLVLIRVLQQRRDQCQLRPRDSRPTGLLGSLVLLCVCDCFTDVVFPFPWIAVESQLHITGAACATIAILIQTKLDSTAIWDSSLWFPGPRQVVQRRNRRYCTGHHPRAMVATLHQTPALKRRLSSLTINLILRLGSRFPSP
jgi:hypothetical protein